MKWRSFTLRACASKNKKHTTASASLCEGPIFYFSIFTFMPESIMFIPILHYLFSSWQASCVWERSRNIYPVGCRWSWVIIVDITLEVNKLEGKIISPYLSMYLTKTSCSINMSWVSAIIEDYMMVEYVNLLNKALT
mgnify:CR=1 FL=1